MKKHLSNIFLKMILTLAMLTLGGTSFIASRALSFEDTILAIVNDDIITAKDLQDYIHSFYIQLKMEGHSDQEIKSVMSELETNGLKKLIDDRLMLSEANRVGLEIRPALIDQRLDEIKRSYKNEQKFIDALVSTGATISDIKKKLTDNFKIKYLIEEKVKNKIVVNPQEVTEFYKLHFEEFQIPETLDVHSIFFANNSDKAAVRLKALGILDKLNKGGDFAKIAAENTEGPAIGKVQRGQLRPDIEEAIFNLPEGKISDLIESELGFYIFKVTAKHPAKLASLDEVKSKIKETLFQTKFEERFQEWLTELGKKAFIDIKK